MTVNAKILPNQATLFNLFQIGFQNLSGHEGISQHIFSIRQESF